MKTVYVKRVTAMLACALMMSFAVPRQAKSATAIEYGLITTLISVAIISGAQTLGSSVNANFDGVSNALTNNGDHAQTALNEAETADKADDYETALDKVNNALGQVNAIQHHFTNAIKQADRKDPDIVPELKSAEAELTRGLTLLKDAQAVLINLTTGMTCGNGVLDPGEICDPGSPDTSFCDQGISCTADCICVQR